MALLLPRFAFTGAELPPWLVVGVRLDRAREFVVLGCGEPAVGALHQLLAPQLAGALEDARELRRAPRVRDAALSLEARRDRAAVLLLREAVDGGGVPRAARPS